MSTGYERPMDGGIGYRPPVRRCAFGGCRKLFQSRRCDARFCSSGCRSRASRHRKLRSDEFQGEPPAVPIQAASGVLEPECISAAAKSRDAAAGQPAFIPVVVRDSGASGPPEQSPTAVHGLELSFPSGCVLRVGSDFEEQPLRRLLQVLREEGLC